MNKVDSTKKIQFTIEVATDTLEFLDLKLKFDKEFKQIFVDNIEITFKTSLKVLFYVFEGFAILMRNLKSIVQNVKTI